MKEKLGRRGWGYFSLCVNPGACLFELGVCSEYILELRLCGTRL
jgi:hypothetical protein